MGETPPAATTAETAAACLSNIAVLSGSRRKRFTLPRIQRPSMSPLSCLDLFCVTRTPQDVFGATGKDYPFAFTMSRAWKHTACQDTDDEVETDLLPPPRSPRASHRQPRRRRHGGLYHHIIAVQSMRALLKTIENANSGPRSPFYNSMQSIDGTSSTSATVDTAADTHPHRRPVLPRADDDHRQGKHVGQSPSPCTVPPHASDAQQTTHNAGLFRTAYDAHNRPQGGAAPPPELHAGLINRSDDQLCRRHGGPKPFPQPRADGVRTGDDQHRRRHGGPDPYMYPRAGVLHTGFHEPRLRPGDAALTP